MQTNGDGITKTVYKIVPLSEWSDAQASGFYKGSNDDLRDGFIHLSTGSQVPGTLEKHFCQQQDLLLVSFLATDLDKNLKWEPSRGGALFPHYYGTLPTKLAQYEEPLILQPSGIHKLPKRMGSVAQ